MGNRVFNLTFTNNIADELSKIIKEIGAIKTAVISTNSTVKMLSTTLTKLQENNINYTHIQLNDFAKNNAYFNDLLSKNVSENISLLVVFGGSEIIELVKHFATKTGVPYVVLPHIEKVVAFGKNRVVYYDTASFYFVKCRPPLAYIVNEVSVAGVSNRIIAGLLGELVLGFPAILDALYFKVLGYIVAVDKLKELEITITNMVILPQNILQTASGKLELVRAVFKKDMLLNEMNFSGFSAEHSLLGLSYLTNNKSENLGAMPLTIALMGLYLSVFTQKNMAINYLPNFENRFKKVGYLFGESSKCWLENVGKGENLHRIVAIKDVYEKLSGRYLKYCKMAYKNFKNLFNDKAVFLQKTMPTGKILEAICYCEDVFNGNNLLSIFRNSGYLDFCF